MRIVVVGPCASGKTTLVTRLQELGLDAHNVAQEHSGIKTLWRKKRPDVVVMLEASLPVIRCRRPVPWGEERLTAQRERLKDAREHAGSFHPDRSSDKGRGGGAGPGIYRRENG